ncbi:methylisocitrate lyase [Spongiactinospora rosea]|uniref:Methylisocitrate lyase n=1 Tax=Spongiactinospora rosea TaxID=2248750 RepID=A0A366LSK0_9ACTN|nr:methylisocitrate lyase [Spongiactinospora rosea]RBQ16916.1 methylisocitrate lyase [Spongiactinospora rosea]
MLHSRSTPQAKRQALRAGLSEAGLLRLPGAFSPLAARSIERAGFEGVYVSGAVLSADLALPDVGLTTLSEVAGRAQAIARVTELPTLVDADTGFGEPLNTARTIQILEDAGVAGCHIEDQVNPKRCGHLDGKTVTPLPEALRRLRAAVNARRDPSFVICARTDVRTTEGLDATIERAKAFADAGADLIFPEALAGAAEFEAVRKAVEVPLLANMTEFGKSELLPAATLRDLGINVVIYPVTLLRLAMGAVTEALRVIEADGTQAGLVERMQTRAELYDLLDYSGYTAFDEDVFSHGYQEER